ESSSRESPPTGPASRGKCSDVSWSSSLRVFSLYFVIASLSFFYTADAIEAQFIAAPGPECGEAGSGTREVLYCRLKVPLCSNGMERSQPWLRTTLPFMR